MIKKTLLCCTLSGLLPLAAAAEQPPPAPVLQPEPELTIHAAEPSERAAESKPVAADTGQKQTVLEADETTLLANPELLSRAMYSAVMAQNAKGIKVLLPIYRKWPQHDAALAKFGQALLLQAEGRARQAVALYRELIAGHPDSPVIRMQLAQALFEDRQNEAAADQFDRLKSENLPEPVLQRIEAFRKALRERDSWQFYAGMNIVREQNINQAPKQRRLGRQLEGAECAAYRERIQEPDNDCFQGWTFQVPIDAAAVHYQAGAEKKRSLANSFYAKAGADLYGKSYPSHSRYNDVSVRLSAGVGRAGQRNDAGLTPFHERRIYGNDAYSYTSGARLHWNRWLTPRLQSLTAVEAGRLNNQQRPRSDINSRLFSGSLVFYRNARQYWLAGYDFYRERNRDDVADDFNRYGLRAAWGQEWRGGLSGRLQAGAARRIYYAPGFFSNGANRRDKEWNASVSLWHRAVHFAGVTPRLTFVRQSTSSNDVYYGYGKNRMFIELGKTF